MPGPLPLAGLAVRVALRTIRETFRELKVWS